MSAQIPLFDEAFSFGPKFLQDHAGHIMTDPRIALVELVANSYDAGGSLVEITWPESVGDTFEILDNGTGMTAGEFRKRWKTFSYSRPEEQGMYIDYPPDQKGPTKREAFGQNGKGRYAPFCFANAYEVETWKGGVAIVMGVTLTHGGTEPFHCEVVSEGKKAGQGTCVRVVIQRNRISEEAVAEAIGSKFIVDPFITMMVNSRKIQLLSLAGITSTPLKIEPYGEVVIHQVGGSAQDRTTQLRGITWWVNGRMVGSPSWDGLDNRGAILDGRTAMAKRYSFIVEANLMRKEVKDDWRDFHDSACSLAVRDAVRTYVIEALSKILATSRKDRKREALAESRAVLDRLPNLSKRIVSSFVDEVQQRCPTLSQGDLIRTVKILATLEKARSGYELLEKLAACNPKDLDTWNRLMEEWSASSAEIVLSELKERLDLIERLQELVNTTSTDELHELQPLFARGLWIFGPEYESVEFTSNRTMVTVIRQYLGGSADEISMRRPDFVALPNRSIGIYSADRFDDDGEVYGIRKVLIVELKKGGFNITRDELHQGEGYALELLKANQVTRSTEIVVFVLGADLSDDATDERMVGKTTKIIPMMYDTILKRAHARTFNLQRKLEAAFPTRPQNEDVEETSSMPLFSTDAVENPLHADFSRS